MGNSRFYPPYTFNQIKALILILRYSAIPSMLGLLFLFYDILWLKNRRNRSSYHRLILGMSVNDFISAVVLFLASWPVPSWFPTYQAKGNDATCQATAFLRESAGRASVLYSACVGIYFLLVIKYGWKEPLLKRLELWMHVVNNTVGWAIGIAGFPLKLYNPFLTNCSIQPSPLGCTQSYKATPEQPANCIRGDNATIFQFATWWSIIWASLIVMAGCLAAVYWFIYSTERKVTRYDFTLSQVSGSSSSHRSQNFRKSRKFAKQAVLYCSFFLLSFIFLLVGNVQGQFAPERQHFVVVCLAATLYPLQGFFNCIIYLRPRYLTFQSQQGGTIWDFLNPRRLLRSSESSEIAGGGFSQSSSYRGKGSSSRGDTSRISSNHPQQRVTGNVNNSHHKNQTSNQDTRRDDDSQLDKDTAPTSSQEHHQKDEQVEEKPQVTYSDSDDKRKITDRECQSQEGDRIPTSSSDQEEARELTEATERTGSSGFSLVELSDDFMD